MGRFSGRTLTATPALAAACCIALLLGACSGDDGSDAPQSTGVGTVTETVPESSPEVADEPPQEPATETSDASCFEPATVAPLADRDPIPVRFADSDAAGIEFYPGAMEGEDAGCDLPLTWVKVSGSNGQGGPGATAGSIRETVMLYADGQLVSDPAPILARRIDGVEQIDENTVRVDYAFYTDAPAVLNETDPGSATFHYDGTSVSVTENSVPLSQNDRAETLDLDAVA